MYISELYKKCTCIVDIHFCTDNKLSCLAQGFASTHLFAQFRDTFFAICENVGVPFSS